MQLNADHKQGSTFQKYKNGAWPTNLYSRYPGPRAGGLTACLLVNVEDFSCGHAIGTGVMPAASENFGDTPIMTMSRMLLARKQSLGSQVMDRTVLSVACRRLITRLVASCHEEQTQRGQSMRFGVIKIPLQMLEPCSHAIPDKTGSGCDNEEAAEEEETLLPEEDAGIFTLANWVLCDVRWSSFNGAKYDWANSIGGEQTAARTRPNRRRERKKK